MANIFKGNIPGPKGKSAYRVAVDAGFKGTEEAWLASLKGKDSTVPGPIGPTGLQGPPGDKGDKGDKGERGWQGEVGPRGTAADSTSSGVTTVVKGDKGDPGEPGKPGVDGKDGSDGKPGIDGMDGTPGRDGRTPVKGIDYFDGVRGADGYTPIKGIDYFDGVMGPTGLKGDPGIPADTSVLSNTFAQLVHTHGNLYQPIGNYITTAMPADAGSLFQPAGSYLTTAQPVGAYLTTAAQPTHTHDYQSTGVYLTTYGSVAHTHDYQLTGNYLTTAAPIGHTHSDLYSPVGNSSAYQTATLASTFAQTGHTHSNLYDPLGNSTAYQTGTLSNTFAVTGHTHSNLYLPLGNSTQWATGTLSSALMPLSYSSGFQTATLATKFITTAAAPDHTHGATYTVSTAGSDLKLTSASNQITFGVPKWLTAAAGAGVSWELEGNNTAGTTGSLDNVLYLSGGNNITLSGNSNTVIVSGGSGDAAPNRRIIEIIPGEYLTKVVTVSATQVSKRVIFNPFWLDGNGLQASTVRIIMSWVTNTTPPVMTYGAGLYSRVNETSFALYDSTTAIIDAQSSSNSAQYSGLRMWDITGMTKTLSEGPWLLGLYFSGTASGAMNGILMGASAWPAAVGYISGTPSAPGLSTGATNNTNHFYPFQGYYSATTAGFPNNVGQSDISGGRAADAFDFYAIIKEV